MKGGVVFDTSVILNVLGSGREETILRALPGRRVVVAVTSREVVRNPREPARHGDPLEPLVGLGLLERIPLPEAAFTRFVQLTGADPPDDLGDGEAGALAAAEVLGLPVALDDSKARRVAESVLPNVELFASVDVFRHPAVVAALGVDLADALFSALTNARMRVMASHDAWVRGLLGPERASLCPSLPRVKSPTRPRPKRR